LTIRLWHFELKPPSGGLSMPGARTHGAQPSGHHKSCGFFDAKENLRAPEILNGTGC